MSTAADVFDALARRGSPPQPNAPENVRDDDGRDLFMDSEGRLIAGDPTKRVVVDEAPRRLID